MVHFALCLLDFSLIMENSCFLRTATLPAFGFVAEMMEVLEVICALQHNSYRHLRLVLMLPLLSTRNIKPEKFHGHMKANVKTTDKSMDAFPGAPKFQWEVTREVGLPKICLKGIFFLIQNGKFEKPVYPYLICRFTIICGFGGFSFTLLV